MLRFSGLGAENCKQSAELRGEGMVGDAECL